MKQLSLRDKLIFENAKKAVTKTVRGKLRKQVYREIVHDIDRQMRSLKRIIKDEIMKKI